MKVKPAHDRWGGKLQRKSKKVQKVGQMQSGFFFFWRHASKRNEKKKGEIMSF